MLGVFHKHPEYISPIPPPSGWSGGTMVPPWYRPIPVEHSQSAIFDQSSLSKARKLIAGPVAKRRKVQKGWELGLLLRLFAANSFTSRGLELKHQGRNVPSALVCPAVALAEGGPRRALPIMHSVSRISPTSAALARAERLAISAAVTGSFTLATTVLTALTRSDNVFGQASFRARFVLDLASGSSSTAKGSAGAEHRLGFGNRAAASAPNPTPPPSPVLRSALPAAPGFPCPSASAASRRPRRPPRPNHREAAGAPTPGPLHESVSPSRSAPDWRAASPGRYTAPSASGRNFGHASGACPTAQQFGECVPGRQRSNSRQD